MLSVSTVHRSSATRKAARKPAPVLAAALVLSAFSFTALADDATQIPSIAVGTRVKVSAPEISTTPVIGTVRALDAKSLTVDVSGRTEPLAVPRDRIRRLEVSTGRRSRWTGALIGGLLGAAAGAALGNSTASKNAYDVKSADQAGGAVLGLLVGAGIGALIPPGERWQDVSSSRYRVSFAPRVDRTPGIAFALSF